MENTLSGANAPSKDVLQAFGATEEPISLAGGQRQNYRSGSIVLKPAKDDEETTWIAEFYLTVRSDGFRLPAPIRSRFGGFVYDGWQAWEYLEGDHKARNWLEIIEVCVRFHRAIAGFARPAYFARREQNPWVIADQVTWGEMQIDHHPRIAPAVDKLRQCLRPINEPSQLIHGDFGGNVLFSELHPPAVIDFSPYWRPVEFAIGVIVADAIVWEGADESLIEACRKFRNFEQHLARAELRRIIEIEMIHHIYSWDILNEVEAHFPIIEMIQRRCRDA